jgi:hypothetical protein
MSAYAAFQFKMSIFYSSFKNQREKMNLNFGQYALNLCLPSCPKNSREALFFRKKEDWLNRRLDIMNLFAHIRFLKLLKKIVLYKSRANPVYVKGLLQI